MKLTDIRHENLKIAVIGFGRIGRLVSKLLMSYDSISEIMIYTAYNHEGYIEELHHINKFGININMLTNMEQIKKADYFIISSSVDYSKLVKGKTLKDEWKIELLYNVEIMKDFLVKLGIVKGKRFLIYTNPVDVISHVVYKQIGKYNEIYGFGVNLDTMRLKNLVNKNGYIIGEHGISMVPIGISEKLREIKYARDKIIKSVATVTGHQGFTLTGPEAASIGVFNALFGKKEIIVPLSIYDEDDDVFYGWSLLIKSGNIFKNHIELNRAEKEMLKLSIEKIKLDIKEI